MALIIVIPIYLLINFYMIKRILRWMELCHHFFKKRLFRYLFIGVYVFFATSLLTAFFLPHGTLQRAMKHISNYWLGTMLYGLLFLALGDLLVRLLKRTRWGVRNAIKSRINIAVFGGLLIIFIASISLYGVYHATKIQTRGYQVSISKNCAGHSSLRVVLLADLHLGYNMGTRQLQRTVDKVNALDADIVLIAGDIFDNDYDSLDDPDQIARILKSMKSRYGTYATYGNHDIKEKILGGFTIGFRGTKSDSRMDALLEDADVTLLQDESVLIDDAFYLVGRRDAHKPGTDDGSRAAIADLTSSLDQTKPIFVIDHEPSELEKTADAGADLDFSGHTHDGQMFPGNLTIHFFWSNPHGIEKVEQMYSIVTSGVGLWGPNMRVGTDSEVAYVDVTFS